MNFRPHIVHSHDWHASFAPLWLRSNYRNDPMFAGTVRCSPSTTSATRARSAPPTSRISTSADAYLLHQDDLKAGTVNALKHGILHADA